MQEILGDVTIKDLVVTVVILASIYYQLRNLTAKVEGIEEDIKEMKKENDASHRDIHNRMNQMERHFHRDTMALLGHRAEREVHDLSRLRTSA